jgi:hypothetical protein
MSRRCSAFAARETKFKMAALLRTVPSASDRQTDRRAPRRRRAKARERVGRAIFASLDRSQPRSHPAARTRRHTRTLAMHRAGRVPRSGARQALRKSRRCARDPRGDRCVLRLKPNVAYAVWASESRAASFKMRDHREHVHESIWCSTTIRHGARGRRWGTERS